MSEQGDKKQAEEAVTPAAGGDENAAEQKGSGSIMKFFGFLLLVAAIVGGGLAATGQLMPTLNQLKAKLSEMVPASEERAVAEPATAPVVAAEPVVESAPQPEPIEPEPQIDAAAAVEASQEAEALRSTIDGLRQQLEGMEAAQRTLRASMREQQQMNLQVRLRWITDPASRVPQIQLAWEEISLLPGLDDTQRQQAEAMATLARNSVQQLRDWQAALQKWGEALETPVHEDIMPKPEHPWLAWIVGQFRLRQAPSAEARRLTSLREHLEAVSRALTLEQWPADGEWQALRAELLLQVKAMQQLDDTATVDLGLPDNFTGIRDQMAQLRDAARNWSHGSKGAF